MKTCANCNGTFFFGARELNGKLYCSRECHEFVRAPEFCGACQKDTLEIKTGNLITVNGVGKAFLGKFNKCPECHSVERYMLFLFGVPLLPLGKWRVKSAQPRRFIARKIMNAQFPDFSRQHLPREGRMSPLIWALLGVLALAVTIPVLYDLFLR